MKSPYAEWNHIKRSEYLLHRFNKKGRLKNGLLLDLIHSKYLKE